MAVSRYSAETDTPLGEVIAAGLRENNRHILLNEQVAAFVRRPEFDLETPSAMGKAVSIIRRILCCPQEIKSKRGWRSLARFAIAALDLNDRYTLNAIAHCAEMGVACTEDEKLNQVMLMCLGNRALPEQVLSWSEWCIDIEPASSMTGLCRAGQVAHQNHDKDALKGILRVLEKLAQSIYTSPEDASDNSLEYCLMAARYDDLCSKPSIEVLCERAMQVNPILREKYCREICAAFPQHTSPQKCAICAKRYSGCTIIRE
jgi:hypothetical protein